MCPATATYQRIFRVIAGLWHQDDPILAPLQLRCVVAACEGGGWVEVFERRGAYEGSVHLPLCQSATPAVRRMPHAVGGRSIASGGSAYQARVTACSLAVLPSPSCAMCLLCVVRSRRVRKTHKRHRRRRLCKLSSSILPLTTAHAGRRSPVAGGQGRKHIGPRESRSS